MLMNPRSLAPVLVLRALTLLALAWPAHAAAQDPHGATSPEARLAAWDTRVRMDAASPFRGMAWRPVGPKQAGARVEAIAVPPGANGTIYVGVGSGNVWKTVNNGISWTPIFEHESAFAVGDIAVAPSDADVVWVGTGETQPRHSGFAYAGTGVFRSTDGGETWRNMGLHDTHHIGKVLIHPQDPDVVYVAALGHFWTPNAERGVFRTMNGGETWEKVLFVSERTGVVDMAMDPADPDILYAWAWQMVGGPESGLYRSTDAGESWTRMTAGLPSGPLGRAGVDVAPADPNVVYVYLDNQAPGAGERDIVGGEVYRSDDRGTSWRRVNQDDLYGAYSVYGWKFGDIRVAPADPDEIYILGNRGYRSTDGGRTYEEFGHEILRVHDTPGKVLHLDQHEIWLDPADPGRVLLGNDGGLFQSWDGARSWLHLNNIPAAEFYFVATDDATPYRIFGGTQDNAALYGPSTTDLRDTSDDPWEPVYLDGWTGGDSFVTLPDPTQPDIVYYEHQHGAMRRMDLKGGSVLSGGPATTGIAPRAPRGEPAWRFGWYTPFLISRFAPTTLYAGGNRLLKSLDRGETWAPVSGDLSDPPEGQWGVVPFGTITMISESPLRQGVLYVGTEGGSLWRTEDDGASWARIGAELPRKWVSRVAASRHDSATVYASFTGFREDDFRAYLFVSRDKGQSWRSIVAGLPDESINVVVEDPARPDVLYVGTDGGVFVSLDGGGSWHSLSSTLPTTPVHDLTVQARARELVAGTHGRSAWILDVGPLQALTDSVRARAVHVFPVPAVKLVYDPWRGEPGDRRRRAIVRFSYWLGESGTATVTVRDEAGETVRTFHMEGAAGINTGIWDLQVEAPPAAAGEPVGLREARAGRYRIEVAAEGARSAAEVEVLAALPLAR
ncbi:MAG: hypothetical protein WEA24_12675 [Gemmatimonadota bacterium]